MVRSNLRQHTCESKHKHKHEWNNVFIQCITWSLGRSSCHGPQSLLHTAARSLVAQHVYAISACSNVFGCLLRSSPTTCTSQCTKSYSSWWRFWLRTAATWRLTGFRSQLAPKLQRHDSKQHHHQQQRSDSRVGCSSSAAARSLLECKYWFRCFSRPISTCSFFFIGELDGRGYSG